MDVANAELAMMMDVAFRDIHPPSEGRVAVDKEDFAVVAQVEVELGRQQTRGKETHGRYTMAAQNGENRGPSIQFADSIDDDSDVNATLVGINEGLGKAMSDAVGSENIRGEVNAALCPINGGQHGRVGRIAVMQDVETISPGHRGVEEGCANAGEAEELGVEDFFRNPGLVGLSRIWGKTTGRGPAHAAGTAADTVDAKEGIQRWSGDRKGEAHRNPAESRTGISLGEEGMACGNQAYDCGEDDSEEFWDGHVVSG